MAETDQIEPSHLGLMEPTRSSTPTEQDTSPTLEPQQQGQMSLEDYFQHFVLAHQDHMSETELAKRLGISRKSLWERRQRLGIPRGNKKSGG